MIKRKDKEGVLKIYEESKRKKVKDKKKSSSHKDGKEDGKFSDIKIRGKALVVGKGGNSINCVVVAVVD